MDATAELEQHKMTSEADAAAKAKVMTDAAKQSTDEMQKIIQKSIEDTRLNEEATHNKIQQIRTATEEKIRHLQLNVIQPMAQDEEDMLKTAAKVRVEELKLTQHLKQETDKTIKENDRKANEEMHSLADAATRHIQDSQLAAQKEMKLAGISAIHAKERNQVQADNEIAQMTHGADLEVQAARNYQAEAAHQVTQIQSDLREHAEKIQHGANVVVQQAAHEAQMRIDLAHGMTVHHYHYYYDYYDHYRVAPVNPCSSGAESPPWSIQGTPEGASVPPQ